ncbi:DUF2336 domain-containing protein [Phyllobacterium salinisoli]|uniref:DUF2336 domain-containing protein n=1 Tax=Phyllobacterium salinisoli TaxID=1899321 RepID=A0A368K7A7_9HYPH|nr:DUF2336 domain-containing protein [Phyllobacterium salinisoli]RCS24363.1 DUF2336 domain-containing protein [Phyllobacterium salinisoli]
MIIEHFLKWIGGAPVAQRQAAASALARAYLQSNLSLDERCAAEAALTLLLDDSSPKVRAALAEALSISHHAPLQIVTALASEQIEISGFILARSPLLDDIDLIDRVAVGEEAVQRLIAMRPQVSLALSAAIAEVAAPAACADLLRNSAAQIASVSFRRMAERLGHHARVRAALLEHSRLPADCRHMLAVRVGEALGRMDIVLAMMGKARVERVARDACMKVSLDIADESGPQEHSALVEHLRLRGDLTTAYIIRSVAYGKIDFFGAILVALSGQPERRVRAILADGRSSALAALLRSAGLADRTHRPLIVALDAWRRIANQKLAAGPQEISGMMLAAAGEGGDNDRVAANDDLTALMRGIYLDVVRENARSHALAIAAA